MLACAAIQGCLWPTSLTDAVTGSDNVRPVFTRGVPPFGDIISSANNFIELTVFAEDPNPDGDVLHVRLFKLAPTDTTRTYLSREIDLNRVMNTPNLFSGSFVPLDVCGTFGDGTELFVVVADAPFQPVGTGKEGDSNGLTSENHWELRCQ